MAAPQVTIVGGGAAGLVAAISAARTARALGAVLEVVIAEAGDRVGRKILASGNGRCNLSNAGVSPTDYNDSAFVAPTIERYGYAPVAEFFAGLGLTTYADDQGRVYPTSNTASSVLNVLRLECQHLGVREECGTRVEGLTPSPGGSALVVATGGGSTLLVGRGHTLAPFTPVVGPIRTETDPIRGLSGIRVQCAASVYGPKAASACAPGAAQPDDTEVGELLFREYGVSGVMVFDLSRFIEHGSTLSIDFVPGSTEPELEALLASRAATLDWRDADTFFEGMLHPRVAAAVLRAAGIDAHAPASNLPVGALVRSLKHFELTVLGSGDAKQAQVTRGGVTLGEVDPSTLESRLAPNVFIAGEVLDVDGRCGGYNLHWAWASGMVAGEQAARRALGVDQADRP